jgi:ankyrin repeat protein
MLVDLKNQSALIQAVFAGDLDEVSTLIEQKVDINYQSPSTRLSALHVAAYCSGSSNSSISSLSPLTKNKLSLNLDINNPSETNDEIESDSVGGKFTNCIEIVILLCKSGARVNSKDIKSLTPLHYACRSNSYETVRILLDHQVDVNSRDRNWQSALHICGMYNSVKCAEYLLEHMLNVDVSDRQGRSALAHASFNGNTEMVELLLDNGANDKRHSLKVRLPSRNLHPLRKLNEKFKQK